MSKQPSTETAISISASPFREEQRVKLEDVRTDKRNPKKTKQALNYLHTHAHTSANACSLTNQWGEWQRWDEAICLVGASQQGSMKHAMTQLLSSMMLSYLMFLFAVIWFCRVFGIKASSIRSVVVNWSVLQTAKVCMCIEQVSLASAQLCKISNSAFLCEPCCCWFRTLIDYLCLTGNSFHRRQAA